MKFSQGVTLLIAFGMLVFTGCADKENASEPGSLSSVLAPAQQQLRNSASTPSSCQGYCVVTVTKMPVGSSKSSELVYTGLDSSGFSTATGSFEVVAGYYAVRVDTYDASGNLQASEDARLKVLPNRENAVTVTVLPTSTYDNPEPIADGMAGQNGNPPCLLTVNVRAQDSGFLPPPPSGRQPIFWNTLDDNQAVENSIIGPDGIVSGNPGYAPAVYCNGISSWGVDADTVVFPLAVTCPDQGSAEFYFVPSFSSGSSTTGLLREILTLRSPNMEDWIYLVYNADSDCFHAAVWSAKWTSENYRANYRFNRVNLTAGQAYLITFRWDGQGDLHEKCQLFINGVKVPFDDYGVPPYWWGNRDGGWSGFDTMDITFNHISFPVLGGTVDNLQIFDYLK